MQKILVSCCAAVVLGMATTTPAAAAASPPKTDVLGCAGTLFLFPQLPATILVSDAAGGVVVLGDNPYISCPDFRALSGGGSVPWPQAGQPSPLFSKWAVPDGAGGLVGVWRDLSGPTPRLRASRWDATGTLVAGWPAGAPIADTFAVTSRVEICPDGHGGAFCAWVDDGTGSHLLYARHVFSDGTVPAGTPKAVCTVPATRTLGTILPDGADGAFVVWTDDRDGPVKVFAQRIDATLLPQWDLAGVSVAANASTQQNPVAAPDGTGGLYVAWYDDRAGNLDVFLQRLTSAGTAATGWAVKGIAVTTNANQQSNPAALSDGAGGVYLAWSEGGAACEVFATRIDASGSPVSGWPAGGLPVCTLAGSGATVAPRVVPDHSGGLRIAWQDHEPLTNFLDLRVQTLTASGVPHAGWPADGVVLASNTFPSVYGPALEAVSDASDGTMFIAWSLQSGGLTSRGYGREVDHLHTDGTVPVLASLAQADVSAGSIRLRWFTEGLASPAHLERDAGDAAWAPLGSLTDEGGGYGTYEDRDVRPGGRYGYRLTWSEDGTVAHSAAAYFDVPALEALRLEGATPNPASGRVRVAFALSSAGAPAVLEAFDIAGRRAWMRRVETLGAGHHELAIEPVLAPGVYRLRLTQGGEVREKPVAIVR